MKLRDIPRRVRFVATGAVLLAVAAVVADRSVAAYAGTRLAERVRCAAGLDDRPVVRLGGAPFAYQVLTGHIQRMEVTVSGVRRGPLTARLAATLRDVTVPGLLVTTGGAGAGDDSAEERGAEGRGAVRVGAAEATALIGYDVLGEAADAGGGVGSRRVTERDGLLAVATTARLRGVEVPVTVLADPALEGSALVMRPRWIEAFGVRRPAGDLVGRLTGPSGGTNAMGLRRDLPALPAGLRYRAVAATPDGLRLTVAGSDMTFHLGSRGATPGRGRCGGRA